MCQSPWHNNLAMLLAPGIWEVISDFTGSWQGKKWWWDKVRTCLLFWRLETILLSLQWPELHGCLWSTFHLSFSPNILMHILLHAYIFSFKVIHCQSYSKLQQQTLKKRGETHRMDKSYQTERTRQAKGPGSGYWRRVGSRKRNKERNQKGKALGDLENSCPLFKSALKV